jgi:hypothetical protein
MSNARKTRNGLLIPAKWLKGLGDKPSVQRSTGVVLIESGERRLARRRLAQMVRKLRKAGTELGNIQPADLAAIVNEVRKARAGHR